MYGAVPIRRALGDCYGVDDFGRPICDSPSSSDNPGLLPGSNESWGSYFYRAATGVPSPEQQQGLIEQEAGNLVKASAGRITLDQARAQAAHDVNASLPKKSEFPWIVAAALGVIGIGTYVLVSR
jgi:hypothetical protein